VLVFFAIFALVRLVGYVIYGMVKLMIFVMVGMVTLVAAACTAISSASSNRRRAPAQVTGRHSARTK
jgi:membrane protein required for beta-lactamase induction